MDCLCCTDGGVGPASDTEFLGSVCQLKTADGTPAQFPAVAHRYTLYVIAGCPFAARPWSVLGFYGLTEAIPVVKLFPASYEDGWFFQARSAGEKELCQMFPEAQVDTDPNGYSHLRELYLKAHPEFKGAISVPLLWDSELDTAVSNSSLGLAEMVATQMRGLGTRHQDVLLFPCPTESPDEHRAHNELVKDLHSRVTTAVYKINTIKDGKEHDKLVDDYFATLEELQERIITNSSQQHGGPSYLMGKDIRFADLVFFISLVRLDLAYQWRFGLGRRNVRENYPGLWSYVQRILRLPGMADTVLPRDIMALYFMTPKWVISNNNGRTLPQVPENWEKECRLDECKMDNN